MGADVPEATQPDKKAEQPPKRRCGRMRMFEWLSIVFDLLLFVATCTYAVFAYLQWGANRDAADAAKDAAKAAIESNRVAREAMENDGRAWVLIEDIEGTRWNAPGLPADFRVWLHNFGKAPAHNVVTRSDARTTWRPKLSLPKYTQAHGTPMVAPGKRHPVTMVQRALMPETVLSAVLSGEARFYLRVRVDYRDPFSRHRRTKFCLYYRLARPELPATMTFCDGGNGAR
jgi:hypothetical protein